MEFWHAAFLAGTATFAIPVVIHLMFRMRKKRLVFSSLRFLQQSVLRQSHRLRLRELLLLLLRCAACILIALAFARPFRPDSALAGPGGKPAEDLVIVLDDSPSLLAQERASLRWHGLLAKIKAEIGAHPSGDRVGLVLSSEPGRAEIELSGNFGAVLSALQQERPASKRGDLTQALNTAIETLVSSAQPTRRIVVYTDLQANQIERGAWAEAAQKAAAAGRGIVVQIEPPFDGKPAKLSNLSVTDVRPKTDVWIEGRPVSFAVRIANHGDGEHPSLPVKLCVNGKPISSRTVALGPRSSVEFELAASFPRPGEVAGTVQIDVSDVLPEDDHRDFALRLRDSVSALVVEERLSDSNVFLDEGYYVRMALEPKARGADSLTGVGSLGGPEAYVQVQSQTSARLSPDVCRKHDLIFLVGISALTDEQLAALEGAVREGKKLVLFVGASDGRITENFYNGAFWKAGHGLLPARPGPLYEGNLLDGRYHQLGEYQVEHQLFSVFAGENEAYLRLPRYIRHFQANPADLKLGTQAEDKFGEAHPEGRVLATFSDGTPFALERSFGKGTVLMFPFAPRVEATDLPRRKCFVPLLHQAVRHLVGVTAPARRNLTVGEGLDFAQAGAPPEAPISVEKPGSRKELLNFTGADQPNTDTTGIYVATFKLGQLSERTLFAVNLDARESDLNCEDLDSLRAVFTSNTEKPLPSLSRQVQWDDELKSQAPDWRYFLVAALLCLLLELWLRDFWEF